MLDPTWGASFSVTAAFRGRAPLLAGVRMLVSDLCSQCLEHREESALLVMAVQELMENLVKYSEGGDDLLRFELCVLQDQPTARICTRNRVSSEHRGAVVDLVSRIVAAPDANALYDEMVASSGERDGSRLGLIRVRAEAGLALSYSVESDRLSIAATRPVQPKARER